MTYIKTKLGEHDYHKKACSEFCKLGREFCPFVHFERNRVENIVRWSDIADSKNEIAKNQDSGITYVYTADFSINDSESSDSYESQISDIEGDQIAEELSASGYTCWGDGSGFEYDKMSRNVIGPGSTMESIYDISNYGIEHEVLKFSTWNAWIDKFQYDYRFGRVSDTNAECVLFPNVDNPWMFTEYVFKGIGDDSKKCHWTIPEEYVVEPLVYDADTLTALNSDFQVSSSLDYNEKYSDQCVDSNKKKDEQGNYYYDVKRCRQIINWGEWTTWSLKEVNDNPTIYQHMNKGSMSLNCNDEGIKLFRAKIPVQSIKWGEHGNIPPHTLDMTAPKSWFDPANTVTRMKAVYDAVIGTVISSPYIGKIEWMERYAYIYTGMNFSTYNKSGHYYEYSEGEKTAIQMPSVMNNGEEQVLKPYQKLMPSEELGEYCHNGCANLIGINGKMYCNLMHGANDYTHERYFILDFCLNSELYGGMIEDGTRCDKYISSISKMKIASYQDKRIGVDQMSINFTNAVATGMLYGVAGGVIGAVFGTQATVSMLGNEMDKMAQYYSNLGKRGEVDVSYIVRYEPVMGAESQAQLNKKKYNEFGKGVQIVPGTGKYAIDSEANANPFSGGDTNVYDDINTLSFHRFFTSIMHCANPKHCNEISGQSQKGGFKYDNRAGGEGHCKYYKEKVNGITGCPYNSAPKRAIEFASCANGINEKMMTLKDTYEIIGQYFIWDLEPGNSTFPNTKDLYRKKSVTVYESGNDDESNVSKEWCLFYSMAVMQLDDNRALIAIKYDEAKDKDIDNCGEWCGCALLAHKKFEIQVGLDTSQQVDILPPEEGYMLIGMFRTKKSTKSITINEKVEDGKEEEKTINAKIYTPKESFYWFTPVDNKGNKLVYDYSVIPCLRQNVDENNHWLCMSTPYLVPTTNCVIVDNEKKFIGGWHPEYKDYSKIGGEFMQDIVSDASREGQGMGDYIHNGDFTPVPQTVNKKGYWIDQSGVYIVDERSTGIGTPIASDGEREGNNGEATCISFKKSNTEIDMETGRKKQPKVLNAAVFSNDPYDFLINVLKPQGRPKFRDPDNNYEYTASPIINNRLLLPTMRHALHCPRCDYYIPYKYKDVIKCPWCGSTYDFITGSDGKSYGLFEQTDDDSSSSDNGGGDGSGDKEDNDGGLKEGDIWPESASVIRKFFKIYSIGIADVWAPPGTAIKTDAYFWRHQAQITNASRKQILHRLGDIGNDGKSASDGKYTGGVYLFNKMSPTSEMTLGYPEGLGNFIRVPRGSETDTTTDLRYTAKYIRWKQGQDAWLDGMYNPTMPRHMIPEWYEKSDEGFEDEGVIAPYTSVSEDALKEVSIDQMRVLRNAIEPIYAYTSEDSYSGDYPIYRASYDQREKKDQPIIWQGRKSVISPQVLAVTDGDHEDSYQTYFSGDLVYGNVREYFPSGYTWWMLKNVIGGRYTAHTGGDYHMDLPKPSLLEKIQSGFWEFIGSHGYTIGDSRSMSGGSGGIYTTSDRTVAKCAISLYGLVPLDKEIEAAYIIVRPSGVDPSKNPIGRSWTGGPVMYHHYHAFPKDHYEDGKYSHLHGTAGYPNDQYFDDDGNFVDPHPGVYYLSNDIGFQDDSAYRLWGRESHLIDDDRGMYYEDKTKDIMTSIPCLYDTAFYRNIGTSKKIIYSFEGSEVLGMGYEADSFGDIAGFTLYNLANTDEKRKQKFQYIVVDKDGFVVNKYPDSRIWKTDTTEQIEKMIRRHTAKVELKVSDGTKKNTVSYRFTQVDADLYQNQMPRQSQPITGYFDMSWANVKGYVYNEYEVETKSGGSSWNAPVIFQDPPGKRDGNKEYNSELTYKGNSESTTETVGQVARCIPITRIVKDMWEQRIDRGFSSSGGCMIKDIKGWKFYSTLKKGNLNELDDDVAQQNQQIIWNDYTLLTHGVGYPELNGNLDEIPEISIEGDKYSLAEKQVELVLVVSMLPVKDENKGYDIQIGDYENIGDIPVQNPVQPISENDIQIMFKGAKIKKESDNLYVVTSKEKIVVNELLTGNCYELLGLATGTYEPVQNRVVDFTKSNAGYSPRNLFAYIPGKWSFNTYSETTQYFVVDLLRAPLCKWQRDWRYEGGGADYSNVKCPELTCVANKMGCGIAATKYNKYFSSSTSMCPICGKSLTNAPGVIMTKGDGIMTYEYDAPFSPNPYINYIYVNPFPRTGYRVFIQPFGFNTWRCILNVEYRQNRYRLLQLPDDEVITVDLNNTNGEAQLTILDGKIRARYVKVECEAEMIDVFHEYEIYKYEQGTPYQVLAIGNFKDMDMGMFTASFEGASAKIVKNDGSYTGAFSNECQIIASHVIDNGKMLITVNKPIVNTFNIPSYSSTNPVPDEQKKKIQFNYKKQVGGLNFFQVYGLHYKTKQSDNAENDLTSGGKYLTVTDIEDEFQWRISPGQMTFKLFEPPTQIFEVSVGKNGAGEIKLEQVYSKEELLWDVEDFTVSIGSNNYNIKKIIGGKYYYDIRNGKILIPNKCLIESEESSSEEGEETEKYMKISEFEKEIKDKNIKSYLPNTLVIRYWSGNGKSITFHAKADGHGPSYMVEKNAIQEIDPEVLLTLPSNGTNCMMMGVDGDIIPDGKIQNIPWICYNNTPATISIENQSRSNSTQGVANWTAGEFRKPNFTGKEIHEYEIDDDDAFVKLYGTNCENCHGQCETDVTLIGAPNQIISGRLRFIAKERTDRTINVGGNIMTYSEKTGGLKNGIIIVSCSPVDTGDGRVTLTYGIPELLIYASESKLYSVEN